MKKRRISRLIQLVLVMVMLFGLTGCGAKKLDLNKYLTVTFEGYNNYGKAIAEFDQEKFAKENSKLKMDLKKVAEMDGQSLDKSELKEIEKQMKQVFGENYAVAALCDGLAGVYSIDVKENLSNGDTVHCTWSISDDEKKSLEEVYGIKINAEDRELTVSGLEEVETCDIFEGVELQYDGINGMASASVDAGGSAYGSDLRFNIESGSKLKNGDTVKVTASLSGADAVSKFAEKYGKIPATMEKEFEVSGLEEAEQFDPFEGIHVTFEGLAPDGSVSIEKTSNKEVIRNLSFAADPSSGLSNGDTVKVTISAGGDVEDYCLENYGVIPTETSKEYTVEGLSGYITTAADIPEDVLDQMKSTVEDAMTAKRAREWGETEILRNAEYIGNYFILAKPGTNQNEKNGIYLLYKINVEDVYEDGSTQYDEVNTYYDYYYFGNIMKDDKSNVNVDLNDYYACKDTVRFLRPGSSHGWVYEGYEDIDTFFNRKIATIVDKYSYENNVSDTEDEEYELQSAQGIPAEAVEYEGHHYLYVPAEYIHWDEAKARCEQKGGHLVTITSAEEQEIVIQLCDAAKGNPVWIGGEEVDGQWTWVTGEEFQTVAGEIGNKQFDRDDENRYLTLSEGGSWKAENIACSYAIGPHPYGYICEWDE